MKTKYTDLKYDEYKKYEIRNLIHYGGYVHEFVFPNSYGASVIKHDHSYGASEDLFELAVTAPSKDGSGGRDFCYTTPITNDVIGYLSNMEVLELFERIMKLGQESDPSPLEVKRIQPLGLTSKFVHDWSRLCEIADAIKRYTDFMREQRPIAIPVEWIEEYNELADRLNEKMRVEVEE